MRRDANEHLKKLLKDKAVSRGRRAPRAGRVQKPPTDGTIAEIDKPVARRRKGDPGRLRPHRRGRPSAPTTEPRPAHVAIVMDGNGAGWPAACRASIGHKQGVEAGQARCDACADRGVEHLTVFAFSSENWKRPAEEVSGLMGLVLVAVEKYLASWRRRRAPA